MRTPTILTATSGALLLLTLTACGSNTASSEASSAAASPAASSAAGAQPDFTAYRDCMADNGVPLPDMGQPPAGGALPSGAPSGMSMGIPPSGAPGAPGGMPLPDGVDREAFDAAQAACESVRPTLGQGAGAPGDLDATAIAAFKSCLTDHGVTIPDGDAWMTELDRSDATVRAALDTCGPLLPQPGTPQ